MARFTILAVSLAAGLLATGSLAAPGQLSALEATIHEAFDQTLAQVKADMDGSASGGHLRSACPPKSASSGCRVALPAEPEAAHELLPFLMEDPATMAKWRGHFLVHVQQEGGGREHLMGAAKHAAFPKPLVHAISTRVFWDSRPAASQGALNYWKHKAQQHLERTGSPVSWQAHVSEYFADMSIREARKLMGTFLKQHLDEKVPDAKFLGQVVDLPQATFPVSPLASTESFDAREAFAFCKDVIGHVRDQGSCGSCWAMASTEAFNDRLCIATGGHVKNLLSVQHTTSCCNAFHCFSFGCHGGLPQMAWRWFVRNGVVTGGDFTDVHGTTCLPYKVPNCSHHTDGPYPDCSELVETPPCESQCSDKKYEQDVHDFAHDLHKADRAWGVSGLENIRTALSDKGSLTAAFMVYEDFVMYKSGVYHHVSGSQLGGHAVKLIGWGTEDGKPHWLAVNSWNHYWGEEGSFRIASGECGFESEIVGGDVSDEPNPSLAEL